MTELEAALVDAVAVLNRLSIPYMLIGGLAVAVWGESRATLDVDLSLWVEPGSVAKTIAAIGEAFRLMPADPAQFIETTRVLPAMTASNIRIDFIFAALAGEKEVISRARPKQINHNMVMVASVEDLIWMKLISEREKDREDARRLLHRFRNSLDAGYLTLRLTELSEAFARQDILDAFYRELHR